MNTLANVPVAPLAQSDQIGRTDELHRLIAAFRRRLRFFVSVVLVILAAVVLVTYQQTPRYTATSNVMIDTRKHAVTDIQDVLSGLPDDASVVDTEVEILKSRSLAERVTADQKLDQDPEFNSRLRQPNPIVAAIGSPFAALSQILSSNSSTPASRELSDTKAHEAVVDNVLQRLKVHRDGLTYVINVAFESEDPVKAANIANAFANLYLTQQLQDKYDATQQATRWLDQRLAELQPQVEQAEAAVEQYKAQHGLLASVGSTLTEQEISNLDNQLAQAQADQAEHDARLRTAQQQMAAGSTGEDFTGALTSETVKELRAKKAEISAQVADLQTKYGPRHPAVQQAQRQLTDIDSQIQQEVARTVQSLQDEDQVARGRTASIEASLAGAKGTLVGNNAASVQLADLQRTADATSALYDSLLNRAKQTSTDQGSETSDARIVSRAKIPTRPSFPNKQLNFALGLVSGFVGAGALVFLLEALDSGLRTSEDVERLLGVPHLGAIPALDSTTGGKDAGIAPTQYIVDRPLSAFAEAFRNLRASIQFSKIDEPVKVVMVTSSLPGEGKTTTTFCLGRSVALSGVNVVIVDCDLRRRNINRLLGIEVEKGLIEVLQGTATLDDALVFDSQSGAWFLPLAKPGPLPKDLFGSGAMDRLLSTLRNNFELVLLDTAPVIPVSDTRVLAPKADVVVFLAQWRKTPRKAIEASFALLKSVGADIVGVALTLVDAQQQAKYGYGDSGYYYHSYRKYYTD